MEKYEINLFDAHQMVFTCLKDLDYVPEHFIWKGDVFTVISSANGELYRVICAEISTPLAIELK